MKSSHRLDKERNGRIGSLTKRYLGKSNNLYGRLNGRANRCLPDFVRTPISPERFENESFYVLRLDFASLI